MRFTLHGARVSGNVLHYMAQGYQETFYTTWRKGIRKRFTLHGARVSGNALIYLFAPSDCNVMPLLVECLPIQIQIMNRMVRFMYSCLKCNNTSLNMLSHLAFHGNGSHMSKRFNAK